MEGREKKAEQQMLILLSVPPVPSGMEINFPSGAIQHFSALT